MRADSPAIDLTYLCAAFWTPAFRREGGREEGLLRRYHRALLAHGVAGYGWDDLLADYRLALGVMIFLPVWDRTNGSSRGYWWPKLQCLTGAYRDWRCAELPGGAGLTGVRPRGAAPGPFSAPVPPHGVGSARSCSG